MKTKESFYEAKSFRQAVASVFDDESCDPNTCLNALIDSYGEKRMSRIRPVVIVAMILALLQYHTEANQLTDCVNDVVQEWCNTI